LLCPADHLDQRWVPHLKILLRKCVGLCRLACAFGPARLFATLCRLAEKHRSSKGVEWQQLRKDDEAKPLL
jgi:hypothetical protein